MVHDSRCHCRGSDKDREGNSAEQLAFVHQNLLFTMMQQNHEMTRQEREANNGRKPKSLTDGHLMLFPYPSDSNDNQHAENKSTEKQ